MLAFLFVIGVLVFVHELGHHLVAKWFGVRVLTFSLGFGPKLVSVHYGGTDYCLSAIPLGGYVKMAGEHPERAGDGQADEFLSKPKWQRFQILVAGPMMNIALAVVVTAVVLIHGLDAPAYRTGPPVVGAVLSGSPAEKAGIRSGDRILSVSGNPVATWASLDVIFGTHPNRDVSLVLLRAGQAIPLTVRPEPDTSLETGSIGVLPGVHPVIRTVTPGGAADRAGLRSGDVVTAIDGQPVSVPRDLIRSTSRHTGRTIDVTIRRDAQAHQLAVTLVEGDRRGMDVVTGIPTTLYRRGPLEAFTLGVQMTIKRCGVILNTVAGLLSGETSLHRLMGPVGIAQLAGESVRVGWVELFGLMALISLNVGIFNLLPIPLLDGGHIMMLALEGATGCSLTLKMRRTLLRAGLALLLVLTVTIFYNDVSRIGWVERSERIVGRTG
jgi:regulator of sigma E protease